MLNVRNWLALLRGPAGWNLQGKPASWRPREELSSSLESEGSKYGGRTPSSWGTSIFFSESLQLIGVGHPHYGGECTLLKVTD